MKILVNFRFYLKRAQFKGISLTIKYKHRLVIILFVFKLELYLELRAKLIKAYHNLSL